MLRGAGAKNHLFLNRPHKKDIKDVQMSGNIWDEKGFFPRWGGGGGVGKLN